VAAGVFIPVGLLAGMSVNRALSLGLYLVGAFLTIAGFFLGNRGPFRPSTPTAPDTLPSRGARSLRRASRSEQFEAIAVSAVFVVLGIVLMVLGVVVDSRVQLV
jgi:hypothetical protein